VDAGNAPLGGSENAAFIRSCPYLVPGVKLLADTAYHSDARCVCPHRVPELTVEAAGSIEEAERRRRVNHRISSSRQLIEHTFRQLQSQWQFPLSDLPAAFRAACLLANWLARSRHLYV
jgi:hypothetical protein